MRLTAKLLVSSISATIIVITLYGYFTIQRELNLFDDDIKHDMQLLGWIMRSMIVDTWKNKGQDEALQLIRDANMVHEVGIRWVWLAGSASEDSVFEPAVPAAKLTPVLTGMDLALEGTNADGKHVLFVYIPVHISGEPLAALELSEPLRTRDTYVRETLAKTIGLAGVLVALNSALMAVLGIVLLGKPLRRLIARTEAIGNGDLTGTLNIRGRDELSKLAASIDQMSHQLLTAHQKTVVQTDQKIAALEQLRHADRLNTIGRLASGVAHEVGTPLNIISGRAELLRKGGLSKDMCDESLEIIKNQTDRMTTIIRELLDYSRRRKPTLIRTDLADLARQALSLVEPLGRKNNNAIHIETTPDEKFVATVDGILIQQALTNLLINAIHATRNGEIVVSLNNVTRSHDGQIPRDFICISVRDTGTGIAPQHLDHIFDPYFTTKPTGEGTGLGLSITYNIIGEHDGWIEVESELQKGSCFSCYLPQRGENE